MADLSLMNVFLVNFGRADNNSGTHIEGFAKALKQAGHDCVVVANQTSTSEVVGYKEAASGVEFADRRGADIIHAWTPREGVRRFVFDYYRNTQSHAALAIHLEDNEEAIYEKRDDGADPKSMISPDASPHFLALADGLTLVYHTLERFVQPGLPHIELPPIIDFDFFSSPPVTVTREELGIPPGVHLVCYNGNDTITNREDIRSLYRIVNRLNGADNKVMILRTGAQDSATYADLPFDPTEVSVSLGVVQRDRIPGIIALADFCIQPGGDDSCNRYRLPAKVPEYLAAGIPLVIAKTNIGNELEDRKGAFLARDRSDDAFVTSCEALLSDLEAARAVGCAGQAFARDRFASEKITPRLEEFYQQLCASAPQRVGVRSLGGGSAIECLRDQAVSSLVYFQNAERLKAEARQRDLQTRLKAAEMKAKQLEKNSVAGQARLDGIVSSTTWSLAKRIYSIEKRLRKPKGGAGEGATD